MYICIGGNDFACSDSVVFFPFYSYQENCVGSLSDFALKHKILCKTIVKHGNYIIGGCGGGILYFNLTTEIKVDGTLSSNGQGGSGRTGGGSGGSILITTSLFDGTGSIEVILLSHLLI